MLFFLFEAGNIVFFLAVFFGFLLALTIGFTLHEFAHAFAAVKQGDPTPKILKRLTLNPIAHIDLLGLVMLLFVGFGYAKPVPINPANFKKGRWSNFVVSTAGIFVNLVLAFFFSCIFALIDTFAPAVFEATTFFPVLLNAFLTYAILVNLMLAIFNLMPILPLDGFHMVESMTKPGNKYIEFMEKYAQIVMIVFFVVLVFVFNFIAFFANFIFFGFTKLFYWFWGLF